MHVLCFWLNILVILLFDLPVTFSLSDTKTATSGPYRSSIVSVKDCETPSRPYVKDSPITFKATVHNTTDSILLSGNVTVLKDTRNTKIRIKSMIRVNSQWKVNYLINDIGCHSILLHLISTSTNIKYDRKTCTFLKGQYTFKNLDVNSIQHLWAAKMDYGEIFWFAEIFSARAGTFFCCEFYTVTEPV